LKRIFDYLRLFGIAGAVIVVDQWTKELVRNNIAFTDSWLPDGLLWLMPYARIMNWHNSGAAFGSFQGFGWVFTILAFGVAGMIIYYYPRVDPADWWLKLAMGMQMGGALGNVVDRLTNNGQVTDFISVGTFPVFNIADASISVGVAILLLGMWIKEQGERKRANATADEPTLETPSMDERGEHAGG
jgi:signal peptidase II